MTDAIACSGLSKTFRSFSKEPGLKGTLKAFVKRTYRTNQAVHPFDVIIPKGEFVGLLGPNGAGKTTLMKMLTGIVAPSAGKATVLGHEPFKRELAFRRKIALVMGQKSQLWWDIPAMDSFQLLARYYELPDAEFRARLAELARLLDVERLLNVYVRKLSLGERMKVELIASLLHRPEVVFLDEPTIGLDLVAQRNIREFLIRYQREHGTTIVLTSHYMADVAALCSRIVLILGGVKRYDGSLKDFERILGRERFVSVRFAGKVDRAHPSLSGLAAAWGEDGESVELRIPEDEFRQRAATLLAGLPVADLSTEQMPIERVMHTLMSRPELLPEA